MNLNHFRLLRVVGKGAFGKVRIVERKDTGLTFALKYIRKDEGRPYENPMDVIPRANVLSRSGSFGECAQYNSRAEDAGTSQPPVPLQLTIQFPRY